MYDTMRTFRRAAGLKENDAQEPSGDPATIIGQPVTPEDEKRHKEEAKRREDIATDILQKMGTDEATAQGHKPGSASHFEYVKEFVRRKMERLNRREDMEPGEPAANPDDPQQTTTDKELGERRKEARKEGKKREGDGDDKPAWLKAKMDGDDGDDDVDDKDERRKKTESMIEAVVSGKATPRTIVESVFRSR